jgi:hypothetical protein
MSMWKRWGPSITGCAILLISLQSPRAQAQNKDALPYKPAANANEAIARIEKLGGVVRRVAAKDDSLEIDFRNSAVADFHMQDLQALKPVTILHLRETAITDAGLVHVGKIATLKRLYLEKTAVTDAGLRHLTSLKELEVLNLFGATVGDTGLASLQALPRLKSLNLFQTKVSAAALAELQKTIPGLQVVPDVAQDRQRAKAAWTIAKSAREEAENRLIALKKIADDMAPQAAPLKKELDEATKQTANLKKKADDAKKKSEDAGKRAKDLKAQADITRKDAEANPQDPYLQLLAEENRSLADQAKPLALDSAKLFEETQKMFQASQKIVQEVQQRSSKVSNARKMADDAQKHLVNYQALEADARKRLDDLQISSPSEPENEIARRRGQLSKAMTEKEYPLTKDNAFGRLFPPALFLIVGLLLSRFWSPIRYCS